MPNCIQQLSFLATKVEMIRNVRTIIHESLYDAALTESPHLYNVTQSCPQEKAKHGNDENQLYTTRGYRNCIICAIS